MLEYLFITFIVIFCIQFIFYILIFGRFTYSDNHQKTSSFNKAVSVIICAKNEAENLEKNLPLLLKQNYSKFELVLINDCSTDNTLEVMEKFNKDYNSLTKIVDVKPNEQFWGSKKYALTLGIKAASFEHLLFIDADCIPKSNSWISEMTHQFNNQVNIVLGYGSYKKIKNSFLNKVIRFETLLTALQYFSYSKIGLPYMGVGRNLAYTKTLFFENSGFIKHMHIKSGDDDLFINQAATKNNTTNCISALSFTESIPKNSFKDWFQQKRRHISTASYYKPLHKYLLGLFYSSQITFWILSITLLLFNYQWIAVLSLFTLRIIISYLIIGNSANKLNEKDLVLFSPFFELFLILAQLFIFIKNLVSKPTHW